MFLAFGILELSTHIYKCNYIVLYEKNAFRFHLGPREVPQPENMHFHFHAFSGWGTSHGPKFILKAFFLLSTI